MPNRVREEGGKMHAEAEGKSIERGLEMPKIIELRKQKLDVSTIKWARDDWKIQSLRGGKKKKKTVMKNTWNENFH